MTMDESNIIMENPLIMEEISMVITHNLVCIYIQSNGSGHWKIMGAATKIID